MFAHFYKSSHNLKTSSNHDWAILNRNNRTPLGYTYILWCEALQMFVWKVLNSCVSRLFRTSQVPKRIPQRIHLCVLAHSSSKRASSILAPLSSRCILGIEASFAMSSISGLPARQRRREETRRHKIEKRERPSLSVFVCACLSGRCTQSTPAVHLHTSNPSTNQATAVLT